MQKTINCFWHCSGKSWRCVMSSFHSWLKSLSVVWKFLCRWTPKNEWKANESKEEEAEEILGRGSSSGMRMSLKATKYVRGMNGRARGRKKRYTKFVTHILKWQLALVWRPMGNFWATNLCLETTLNGMLSHKCFGYPWVPIGSKSFGYSTSG